MAHVMPSTSLSIPKIGSDASGVGMNGNNLVPLERRCDNPDCTVYKMVLNVPKRKTPQFVTEPIVTDKPLLINGFTTIFQVEGQSAKLSDLKSTEIQKPLYRIVPNTHAHIVNYVVVDSDAESLRKINENDPATMRKLLDSQKQSADQMLKKLIAGHSAPMGNINTINNNAPSSSTDPAVSTTTNTAPIINGGNAGVGVGVGAGAVVNGNLAPTPIAKIIPQLPTRVHPNLKITAVASADGLAVNELTSGANKPNTSATSQQLPTIQLQQQPTPPTLPTMPLITPVPLANLQRAPVPSPVTMPTLAPNVPINSNIGMPTMASSSSHSAVDIPPFDKMQQELQELRRTVALLAEAQAKNKQS